MTDEAADLLELGVVKGALRSRAQTPLGRTEAAALGLLGTVAAVRERIESISEARALLDVGEPPPVWGAEDVASALELGEKGVVIEATGLRAIANTMLTGSAVKKHLYQHAEVAPSLYARTIPLVDLSRLANDVARCFDPDGQLADHASRALGPLRQKVRSLKNTIHNKLSELLKSPSIEPYLQETYFTIRAERHVLPVKASFKNEVKGIVHDASGSGQTVFIEPQVLVDLGNRLKIAQSEQAEEEHRILSRLTRMVAGEADAIRDMMRVIAHCDLIAAAARLAVDLDAVPIVPQTEPGFTLKNARHPLLLLQAFEPEEVPEGEEPPLVVEKRPIHVVGNDFGLEGAQRVLILTGPNTGGKTVAMKTIGLFALMARMGLHLPCAEDSKMGWYGRVDATIGDQQSIASNLSTFAAHMKSLVEVIGSANDHSLVLIDEIAADTDPTQGQALAQAVLEELASRDAHVVVTTHFERLKAVPIVDERFRNAGVGFDPKAMRPTYRVTLDVPQGSSGFDIATTLGLPDAIVERGRELIGEGAQELQRLMAELEDRSQRLEAEREEAQAALRKADAEREAIAKREAQLKEEIERVRAKEREDLLAEIEGAREEVREIIAKLQSASEGASARDAMRAANQAADALGKMAKAEAEKVEPEPEAPKKLEKIEEGSWVHVPKLGRDGEVASVDGREATINVGKIKMRVALSQLQPPLTRPPKKAKPSPKSFTQTPAPESGGSAPARVVEQIDLRGHTVDESIDRLEAFLDYHYGTPTTHVSIIHGHGTGVLREALREHLKRSGYVKSMRPGEPSEGGDGVTLVALR
ncbi:MAG: endonuclease MutS2 [Deltaproteobacteria bacterium]